MTYKVGIDIGGTFTDLFAYETETGESLCISTPSTPENYANGVMDVIEKAGIRHEDITLIVHGTTVATNAMIMKAYADTAFVTTDGMRDLVEVGEKKLTDKEKQEFYPVLFSLMEENMKRLEEEVTWFCDKQDYLNRDKDWGNSKDSIQRAIQKLAGGYPADPVFKIDY